MGLIKYWCICKERCFSIKISSTWNLRQSIDISTIPGYAGRIECTIRPKQIQINCQTPISKGMLEVVIGGPLHHFNKIVEPFWGIFIIILSMLSFIFSHLDKFKDFYGFLISCCLKKLSMHNYNITTCLLFCL